MLRGAEMKKTSLALTLIVLFSVVGLIEIVNVVKANPFMFGPHIGIASPQQFKKSSYQPIYQTTRIPVQVQINTPFDYPEIVKVYCILDLNYSLDNNLQRALTISSPQTSTYSGVESTLYLATGTLENLSDGIHTLDAYAVSAKGEIKSGTITFMVSSNSVNEDLPTPSPTQDLTSLPYRNPQLEREFFFIIALIVTVLGAGLVLLVYLIKTK